MNPIPAVALAAGALLPLAASAAESPNVAGIGVNIESSEYRDGETDRSPFPYLDYGPLSLREKEIGLRVLERGALTASIAAELFDDAYPDADEGPLAGLPERKDRLYAKLLLRLALPAGAELNLDLGFDATRHSKGSKIDASLARPIPLGDRLELSPSAGFTLLDRRETRYQYGVEPESAQPDRSAYSPNASLSPFAALDLRWNIATSFGLIARYEHKWLARTIRNSPLVDEGSRRKLQLVAFYAF